MKLVVVLLGVTCLASAYTGDFLTYRQNEYEPDRRHFLLTQGRDGNLKVMNLKDTRLQSTPSLNDLSYYLFTRNNLNNPVLIKNNNITALEDSGFFMPEHQIIFIIHGWENDHTSPVNTLITEALLEFYNVNVLVADWAEIASKNYFTARFSVETIGKLVGNFISDISEKYQKPYNDFVLIGHSLGAHVAGVAGSTINGSVDHIVGLDPAQPLFTLFLTHDRLDHTDADFVQIIHTNGGHFGFLTPLGHADYYPNGGEFQPGCFFELVTACSHGRSYMYYADSIKKDAAKFWAIKCDSYDDYIKGKCNKSGDLSAMGRFEVDKKANGSYYLNTKSKEPFAIPLPTQSTIYDTY